MADNSPIEQSDDEQFLGSDDFDSEYEPYQTEEEDVFPSPKPKENPALTLAQQALADIKKEMEPFLKTDPKTINQEKFVELHKKYIELCDNLAQTKIIIAPNQPENSLITVPLIYVAISDIDNMIVNIEHKLEKYNESKKREEMIAKYKESFDIHNKHSHDDVDHLFPSRNVRMRNVGRAGPSDSAGFNYEAALSGIGGRFSNYPNIDNMRNRNFGPSEFPQKLNSPRELDPKYPVFDRHPTVLPRTSLLSAQEKNPVPVFEREPSSLGNLQAKQVVDKPVLPPLELNNEPNLKLAAKLQQNPPKTFADYCKIIEEYNLENKDCVIPRYSSFVLGRKV